MAETKRWAVVRRSDDDRREWIDTHSFAGMPRDAEANAMALNDKIPSWAKHNPVVRTVEVLITEVVE